MGLFPKSMYEGPNWRSKHGEPQNRRQLFQCVLTDQFFSLIPVNLLYLVFWIPAIVWTALCLLQLVVYMRSDDAMAAMAAMNAWTLGLIPCLAVLGPARAGMALLMRNWAMEAYTPVLATFFKGARDNWKQTIAVSLVTSVLPLVVWSAYRIEGAGVLFWVVCAAAGLFLLAMQVFYVLLVTYELPLKHHFRNAVLLLFMKLPTFVLIRLASLAFVALYVVLSVMQPDSGYRNLLIPVAYYATVGLAVTELIYASYANKLRDDYLTREEEPE